MPAAPSTSSAPSASSHPSAACSQRRGAPASRSSMRPMPTRPATASSGSGRRTPWPAAGTPEIVAGLAPEPGDVVLGKQTYSPFLNPEFERTLEERGLTRLYVTGLHTDCCARHTSGDAFQRGYDLVWVTDALQAFTDEAHQTGLEYFKAWYATDPARQLRTVDELVGEWTAVTEPALA